jgi:hypothetical protein
MNPISQTRLAALAGVTKQAITKVVKADPPKVTIVVIDGKKKIDLDGHLTANYLKGRTPTPQPENKNKDKSQDKDQNKPKPGRPSDNTTTPVNPYQGEHNYQSPSNNPSGISNATTEAKNLKERNTELKNEELEIKISQSRGDLVEKKLSVSIFNKIYGIHENQFKSLSVKTNPKIESIYTSEYQIKTIEILEALGKTGDNDAKKEIMKILNTGESTRFRKLNEVMEDETMIILKNIQFEIDRFLVLAADAVQKGKG